MIVVTGLLLVSSLILSRIGWPHPGFLVSTTTTPLDVTNTAVFPPPPFNINRLSRSFSTSMTFGAFCCAAFTATDSAPTINRHPNTSCRFMKAFPPIVLLNLRCPTHVVKKLRDWTNATVQVRNQQIIKSEIRWNTSEAPDFGSADLMISNLHCCIRS